MMPENPSPVEFGSSDLRLPSEPRGPLREHLSDLNRQFVGRGWGGGALGLGSGRPSSSLTWQILDGVEEPDWNGC